MKCSNRSRVLAQDKVNGGNSWYGGQDGSLKKKKKKPNIGVLQWPSFLSEGLRLPRELTSKELP